LASNGAGTAYDVAIAAATTDAERERLKALRLRFNTPPDSPEWQFYAVLAPLFAPTTERDEQLAGMQAQLDRLERRAGGRTPDESDAAISIPGFRTILPVLVTILACAALWHLLAAYPRPEFGALIAVFALGGLVRALRDHAGPDR
jgi:hypothetical protein